MIRAGACSGVGTLPAAHTPYRRSRRGVILFEATLIKRKRL